MYNLGMKKNSLLMDSILVVARDGGWGMGEMGECSININIYITLM